MFDGVARRYDITNTVLSLGQDRFWRRQTRAALGIGGGFGHAGISGDAGRANVGNRRGRRDGVSGGR